MTSPFEEWWDEGITREPNETRTLRARWTAELQQDLRGMYGLDIEAELSNIMSEEIANEMRLDPILIPTLRRAMPQLIASDLVGVQPMTGVPTGLTFAMRYNPENGTKNVTVTKTNIDHFDKEEDLFKI